MFLFRPVLRSELMLNPIFHSWGHFSTVWLVRDAHTSTHSALKIVKSAARYAETARDEIKLLSQISAAASQHPDHPGKDHLISFYDHFTHPTFQPGPPLQIAPPGSSSSPKSSNASSSRNANNESVHICIVCEPLGENLLSFLDRCKKSYRQSLPGRTEIVPLPYVKSITRQALLGLQFLHDVCHLVHTDIKPENIMIALSRDDIETYIQRELASSPSPTWRNVNVPPPPGRSSPFARQGTLAGSSGGSSFFMSAHGAAAAAKRRRDRNVEIFDSQPLSSPTTSSLLSSWRKASFLHATQKAREMDREREEKETEQQERRVSLQHLEPPNVVQNVEIAETVITVTTVTASNGTTAPIDVPTLGGGKAVAETEIVTAVLADEQEVIATTSTTTTVVPEASTSSSPSPASDSGSSSAITSSLSSSSIAMMSTPATSFGTHAAAPFLSRLSELTSKPTKRGKEAVDKVDQSEDADTSSAASSSSSSDSGSGAASTVAPNTVAPTPSGSESGSASNSASRKPKAQHEKKRRKHKRELSEIESEVEAALNTSIVGGDVPPIPAAHEAPVNEGSSVEDEDEDVEPSGKAATSVEVGFAAGPPSPALTEDSNCTVTNPNEGATSNSPSYVSTPPRRKDHPPTQGLLSKTAPLTIPPSSHSPVPAPIQTVVSSLPSPEEPPPPTPLLVKIGDLGNATPIQKHYTEDIQTRQYRSPEAILGRADWGPTADVWSLACVVFELLTGDYLFEPASNPGQWGKDDDQMAQIIELLSDLPSDMKRGGRYSANLFDSVGKLRYIKNLRPWRLERVLVEKYSLEEVKAKELCSFLVPMLDVDHRKRAQARDVVDHPWLELDEDDEVAWVVSPPTDTTSTRTTRKPR